MIDILAVSGSYDTSGWFGWFSWVTAHWGILVAAGIGAIIVIKLWNALPKWLLVIVALFLLWLGNFITVNAR